MLIIKQSYSRGRKNSDVSCSAKNIDHLNSFFLDNKKLLISNYPGINFHRIKQDLIDFSGRTNFLEEYYCHSTSSLLDSFISSLVKGKPLEYILNKSYFYKSSFYVNEDVLIPRSETEILVEKAVKLSEKMNNKSKLSIADIGTGSGAIILSVLQELNFKVKAIASDISKEALKVAKINYNQHKYLIHKDSEIEFICSDRMKEFDKKFDLILTNPPYIKKSESKKYVHQQVNQFEPKLALYIQDDQYIQWFKELLFGMFNSLKTNGHFIMEGSEFHLEALLDIANELGFKQLEIIMDYSENQRFLIGKK